jgi:uncharacterized protein YaaQ
MPKLLIAILHHDDADAAADALRRDGHRFTRVPTLGGFLETPNDTFVLAAEDQQVDPVLAAIEAACSPREIEVPLVLLDRLADWEQRTVAHGGATVLVTDLERIIRL